MKYLNLWIAAVMAGVITVIVRFAVFTDDCNLFVVGVTFLLSLIICYVLAAISRRLIHNKCK